MVTLHNRGCSEEVSQNVTSLLTQARLSIDKHKGKQKSPGRATSKGCSQPLTPGGREKVTKINVCISNKQMHDKHKDQLLLPEAYQSAFEDL